MKVDSKSSSPVLEKIGGLFVSATRAWLPLAAFCMAVQFIAMADWNRGPVRAGALMVSGWALYLLVLRPLGPYRPSKAWMVIPLAWMLWHLIPGIRTIWEMNNRLPNDVGYETVVAISALDRGASLYASQIDSQQDTPGSQPGFGFFQGYRYGPITPRYYAPFLDYFGYPRGLYAANAVLLVAATLLAASLAANAFGGFRKAPEAAIAAAFCIGFPIYAYIELFVQGVNDLLPAVLAMASLYCAMRKQAFLSGVTIALSLAAKPLPAALYLLLLPGMTPLIPFAAGFAVGLTAFLRDFIQAPREMIANLIIFNLSRKWDNTGLGYFLPPFWGPILLLTGAVLILATAYFFRRGRRDGRSLLLAAALITTVFLAFSKIIHRNYLLWWTPLAGVALALTCYRPAAPEGEEGESNTRS